MTHLMTKTTLSGEGTLDLRVRAVSLTMASECQQQHARGGDSDSIPRLSAIEAFVTACWSIGTVTGQMVGALTARSRELLSCMIMGAGFSVRNGPAASR